MPTGFAAVFELNGLYVEGWGDMVRIRVLNVNMASIELIGRLHGERFSISTKRLQAWLDDRNYEKVSW